MLQNPMLKIVSVAAVIRAVCASQNVAIKCHWLARADLHVLRQAQDERKFKYARKKPVRGEPVEPRDTWSHVLRQASRESSRRAQDERGSIEPIFANITIAMIRPIIAVLNMDDRLHQQNEPSVLTIIKIHSFANARKSKQGTLAVNTIESEFDLENQYTRALGLIYSASSVSVYSCTGR